MRVRKKQILGEAEINLTPLIDVCFVILIMFIVVAPLLEMEQVSLCSGPPLNQQSTVAVQEKSPVSIYVFANDTIMVNQREVALEKLNDVLRVVKQSNPTAIPQIFHDREAKFGTYQTLKNALEAAGFTSMNVILKPQ